MKTNSTTIRVTTAIGFAFFLLTVSTQRLMAQSNTFPATGNVGIGTTAPDRKLSVNNTAAQSEEAISVSRPASANTSGGRSPVAIEFRGDAYSDNPNIYGWSLYSTNSVMAKITATPKSYTELGSAIAGIHASLGFFVQSAGHGGFLERMTILGNGNVGIGTTGPAQALTLSGYASVANGTAAQIIGTAASGTAQNQLNITSLANTWGLILGQNNSGVGTSLYHCANCAHVINFNNASLILGTNNTDRLTINGAGNVGIGITNPTRKLDVAGDINASGTITGGNIQARYQDVAEWVESSQALPVGTVVVLDHTKTNQVVASTQAYDMRVAGVISLRPGLALGEGGEDKVLVATTGRVRMKVDATSGPIKIGDLLVTSDKEGIAMKSIPLDIGGVRIHRPGTLIGKALEPLAKGEAEILVLLSLQ